MEKLEFDVSANLSPLRKDLNTARDDIKGFNDRMKSQTAIELSINVARLKSDLAAVRERLKQDLPKEASIMLSAKAERLSKDISQAGRELTNFLRTGQSDTSVLGKLFDGVQSKFSYFSAALQAVGVGGVGYLSKSVIELASNLQQNQIAFTTMLGSADAAKKMLADLSDFAKKTPFELVGIRETAKQLLAMGVTQENMIPTMKML